MSQNTPNLRGLAARTVDQVIQGGRSLSELLPELPTLSPADRALVSQMVHGVLRHYRHLNWILDQLTQKPFRNKDHDLRALCLVGIYQLLEMRIPDHAAVNETVKALKRLKKPWAKGLLNAVLRRVQRESEQWRQARSDDPAIASSHPDWLVQQLKQDWPEHWQQVLTNNNQPAPMTLRVNQQRMERASYLARLQEAEIEAEAVECLPQAVELAQPVSVERLPGFREGWVSVQDISAQRCALLLDTAPGQRVLDACAAPGGKTAHLLERQPDLDLVAVEQDQARVDLLRDTLERLNLKAKVHCADAAMIEHWWNGTDFDRILLDAPCSATGVIRRHPDIKWLRRETDIKSLQQLQLRLLQQLWSTLATGGRLLYSTCSVLRAENEAVIEQFMAKTHDSEVIPLQLNAQLPLQSSLKWGLQILPSEHGGDGFYYCLLEKRR